MNPSPSAQNPISQPLKKANPSSQFTPSRPSLGLKPGSHMRPTYLEHGRRHGLGQHCSICKHLALTHNLSQALIACLPAELNSAQLGRQAGGQCLGQIMCRR